MQHKPLVFTNNHTNLSMMEFLHCYSNIRFSCNSLQNDILDSGGKKVKVRKLLGN